MSVIKDVENYVSSLMETRFNVITGTVEYKLHDEQKWQSLTDRLIASILRALKSMDVKVSNKTVMEVLMSDFSPHYHPYISYFNELPVLEENEDPIRDFASLVEVDNQEHWYPFLKKWLVAVVAGCTLSDKPNQQMLIFTGPQGVGKTTFFESLVPEELKDYATTGVLNPSSKDDKILAGECFLVIADELSGFSSSNVEAMKQLLSTSFVKVRRPYARNPEIISRNASYCGSTNEEQFLLDPTGNRRYLVFKVNNINRDAVRSFPIDKVWAQAKNLLDNGFRTWFNDEENILINKLNQSFIHRSQEEEVLLSKYEPCERGLDDITTYREYTATEVTRTLAERGLLSNTARTVQKIGIALNKNGFVGFKTNGQRKYVLRQL